MRARNIKPSFFLNEELSECIPESRLLFIGLWCYADKRGRFKWSPKKIKAAIFPYDNNLDIELCLNELLSKRLIIRYVVADMVCGVIPSFEIHQRPHHNEVESIIPAIGDAEIKCHEKFLCRGCDKRKDALENEGLSVDDMKRRTKVESDNNQGEKSEQPKREALRSDILNPDILIPDKKPSSFLQNDVAVVSQKSESKSRSKTNDLFFNAFWSAYPKKVSKQTALKSWQKINPDESLTNLIIEKVNQYKQTDQWLKDGGQFIPHPATWLNGRRWEDEISANDRVGNKTSSRGFEVFD